MNKISDMRTEYGGEPLRRRDLAADPCDQFEAWFAVAVQAYGDQANAMALATAAVDGDGGELVPTVRMLLLKGFDREGFCWYSHADSAKGRQLAKNAQASLLFYWRRLNRQVRIEGLVEQLPLDRADEYFASRPPLSRLAAAASDQSQPLKGRAQLEERFAELQQLHPGGQVPRPPLWVGYRLRPRALEFWQGQENRLHDRFRYSLGGEGSWSLRRLAP